MLLPLLCCDEEQQGQEEAFTQELLQKALRNAEERVGAAVSAAPSVLQALRGAAFLKLLLSKGEEGEDEHKRWIRVLDTCCKALVRASVRACYTARIVRSDLPIRGPWPIQGCHS